MGKKDKSKSKKINMDSPIVNAVDNLDSVDKFDSQPNNTYYPSIICCESTLKRKHLEKEMENLSKKIVNSIFDEASKKLIQFFVIMKKKEKPGSKCSECKLFIYGIRYMCGECPEYFLCECCEEHLNHIHDLIKHGNFDNY